MGMNCIGLSIKFYLFSTSKKKFYLFSLFCFQVTSPVRRQVKQNRCSFRQMISVRSKIPKTKTFDNPQNKAIHWSWRSFLKKITNVLHILLLYLINGYTSAQKGNIELQRMETKNRQLFWMYCSHGQNYFVCSKFYHTSKHKPWMGLRKTGSEQTFSYKKSVIPHQS
jgi:hypothetical protein